MREASTYRALAKLLFIIGAFILCWNPEKLLSQGPLHNLPRPDEWQPRQPPPAGARFVGDQACAKCHSEKVASHRQSGMAQALSTGADSAILGLNPELNFRSGPFSYKIVRRGRQSTYTVSDGTAEISAPILWAFGHGQMGQTFVFSHDEKFYESRVSFYSRKKQLDFTLGAPNAVPASLTEAAGREMNALDIQECFGCHSTASLTSGAQVKLDSLTAGIRCEACHGPGEKHLQAMATGRSGEKGIASLKKMSAEDTSNFCGACHRTWDQVMLLPGRGGIGNVRFQPYRLTNSPCYDTEDRRISCTACHNPHEELKRDAVSYDAKCTACHAPAGAAGDSSQIVKAEGKIYRPCPVAKQSCVTCHMPKVEVPGAHFGFTDHHIRIVRTGRPDPI